MRFISALTAGLVLAAGLALPAAAENLNRFYEDLITRGVAVPTESTLTYRPRSGSGAPAGVGTVRFPTQRGFGTAEIDFDNSQGITDLQDAVLGDAPDFPIGSSVAAFAFTFDPARNVFDRSSDAFGPLLSERAETTGKGKVNVAFSYTYIDYDVFEGEDLDDLDVEVDGTQPFSDPRARYAIGSGATPANTGSWSLDTRNRIGGGSIDSGGRITEGFTNNCGGFAAAPCSGFEGSTGFRGSLGDGVYTLDVFAPPTDVELDARIKSQVATLFVNYGVTDAIDIGIVVPFLDIELDGKVTSLFPDGTRLVTSDSAEDSGLGDIILRGKMRFFESEVVDLAGRVDFYLPTGDEDELRGFGDPAVGLLLVGSKSFGRFSPHANVGVVVRGGGKQQHQLRFSTGFDLRVTDRFSFTADAIIRDDLRNDGIGDFQAAVATGVKINPWRRLVISTNVLWRLNDQGLRADWAPSFSAEYTF